MTTSSISTSTPPGVGDRMSVLHPLVLSNGVRLLVVWVLCCDVIVTAVEADVTRRRQQADVFVGLSCVLTLFYTCEFILKLYVAGTAFWRQPGYVFLLVALALSYASVVADICQLTVHTTTSSSSNSTDSNEQLSIFTLLRALRLTRTLRLFWMLPGSQVVCRAMVATIAWLLAIILLLASWTFVAAMLAQCVFSHSVHYTNAGTAMLTLTAYVVGNGWLDSQPMGAYDSGHVYGICFQVTSRFLLVGLVLSYVMTVLRVTSHYCEQQSEETRQRRITDTVCRVKQETRYRRHQQVQQHVHKPFNGPGDQVSEGNGPTVWQVMRQYKCTLGERELMTSDGVWANVNWLQCYLRSLDLQDQALTELQQAHATLANYLRRASLEDQQL